MLKNKKIFLSVYHLPALVVPGLEDRANNLHFGKSKILAALVVHAAFTVMAQ